MDYLTKLHQELKDLIRLNINEVCSNYVQIGWYLNAINVDKMYQDDGYKGIGDYAAAEYGISPDRCSWLMKVAEKFCEKDSPDLLPEYKDFSISKLREMVYLDDVQLEEIKPETPVKEIRKMKPKPEKQAEQDIDWFVKQWAADYPKDLKEFMRICQEHDNNTDRAKAIQMFKAPYGYRGHVGGGVDCTFRGYSKGIDFKIGEERIHLKYNEFTKYLMNLYNPDDFLEPKQPEQSCDVASEEQEEFVDNYRGEYEDPNHINKRRAIDILARLLVNSNYDWFDEDYTNRVIHVDRSEKQIKGKFLKETYKIDDEMYKEVLLEEDSILLITGQGLVHKVNWFYLCASIQGQWNTIVFKRWKSEKIETDFVESQTENTVCQEESADNSCPKPKPHDERWFTKQYFDRFNESLSELVQIYHKTKSLEEVARKFQKYVAPYDYRGSSCSEYNFTFHGFTGGMDFRVGNEEMHLKYGRLVSEALDLYKSAFSKDDNEIVENIVATSQLEKADIIDEECKEVEPETEEETELDVKYLAQKLLRKHEGYLKDMIKVYTDEECGKVLIQNKRIEVEALKLYIAAIESAEQEAEEFEESEQEKQPELPIMKNNDQRKEFLKTYETWPVWIDNKETEERYYRYNLPDGYSIVIKVYHSTVPYTGEELWRSKETYLIKQGMHFKDGETNTSCVIEHLKDMQKKKGGNG